MYTLSCTSFMFVRRCPINQVTSVSKYSYSNLKTSASVIPTSQPEKRGSQEDFFKRNYVSLGGRRNKEFSLRNLDFNTIVCKSKELFREIQLSELANAPQPAFWYGFSGLAPFVLPPLSFMILGYSPFLAEAQLAFGATLCSFLGGVKWGNSLNEKNTPTWETLGWSVGPQCAAWLSLLLPQTLGFVVLSGALLASAFVDLTTMAYPQWFRAMRLGFTIPAVISLLLTAIMCLLH